MEMIPEVVTEMVTEVVPETATLSSLPLMTKGLLVTGMGLLGVFLVLALFFATIKLMQLIRPKEDQ